MPEIFEGTLSFKGEGKNRRRFISYTSKNDKPMSEPVNPDKLAPSLRDSHESEVSVSFELESSGRPYRIRPAGEDWREPVLASPSPQSRVNRAHNDLKREFHNPYNFVPAPPRSKNGKPITGELGDREPSGHNRYLPDKFSGKLHVRMTVETPLLLPDTARMEVAEADSNYSKKDHKTFPVRVDENDRPVINPTAIKGMLRSAYEAITNSRLSVFQKHDERLAFRSEAASSQGIEPVRIHGKEIHFYIAAWLGSYRNRRRNWNGLDEHGKEVWVKVIKRRHARRNFEYFEVLDMKDKKLPKPSSDFYEGYVCITNENMKNKHDERVFLKTPLVRKPLVFSDAEMSVLKNAWRTLIENYHETHKDELDNPPASLGIRKWSRQIYKKNDEEILKDGTLCYAVMRGSAIEELVPVMISRRLHKTFPAQLLPDQQHPAQTLAELSPADRVFGWVRQSASKARQIKLTDDDLKRGAYRGQLRIGFVSCNDQHAIARFGDDPLPLQILGQPKPQQGRFYVAETQNGEAQTEKEKRSNQEAGFNDGRGLRGRKFYPHHNLPNGYWKPRWESPALKDGDVTFFQEYRRPDGDDQRDNQNRSIKGWIKEGTVFEFDIHFLNLSSAELGGLIWLLDLPENHFHRFGGGKPLGFGSVRLDLESSKSEILNGPDLKQKYEALDLQPSQSVTPSQCKTEFEQAIEVAYPGRAFLSAFKRAAHGFQNKPIHYPRARRYVEIKRRNADGRGWHTDRVEYHNVKYEPLAPHKDGLAYEWFVENAKERIQIFGEDTVYPRLSLKDLVIDDGLPIFSHKASERRED